MNSDQIKSLPNDDISLKDLVSLVQIWSKYILTKWKIITIWIISGAIIGLTYTFLKVPTYKATVTFVLENNSKSKLGGYSSLAAQFGINMGASAGGLFLDDDNIMAFIQSRTMIARTLLSEVKIDSKRTLLIDHYLNFSGLIEKWKGNQRLSNLHFHPESNGNSRLEDSVINLCYKRILKKHLAVGKPDKDLSIISVSTTTTDEVFAKAFTETLLQNVAAFYIQTQTQKATENVNILQRQADSVQSILNSAIGGVAYTMDANPNMNPAFQRLRVPSQKKMIDVEMNKAILIELVKNLEISKISLRKETPLVQIIDTPVLPLEELKASKLVALILGAFFAGVTIISFYSIKFSIK